MVTFFFVFINYLLYNRLKIKVTSCLMRKLTTNEFVEKAKKVHGDEYDYSLVNYINAQTKVKIICKQHGIFEQKPHNHLNGTKCPLCNRHNWTTESFIKEAIKIHGNKYDYSKTEYKSVREKVCIISRELDRNGNDIGEFWQLPLEHLSGHGCKKEKRGENENKWEDRICPICGKQFHIRKKYQKITCSDECRKKYCEIHKDEINEKKSKTLKDTYSKKTNEDYKKSKEKQEMTCLKKYGVKNFSQTHEGREISRQNMKKMRKKQSELLLQNELIPKYKEICEKDNLELLEFHNRFSCKVKCKKCGNIFTTKTLGYLTEDTTTKRCKICNPMLMVRKKENGIERDVYNFLKQYNLKIYQNYREIISPLELDLFLPDYNIAIEINGIYWHNELFCEKNYHLNKTNLCNKKGVRLIHIFEDEWKNKNEICKSRLLNILGLCQTKIGARKCEVREISNTLSNDFLEENHIQGKTISKYRYGLFYNGELVSVMTFGKLRKNLGNINNKIGVFELIRFCCKKNTNISGGADKLLKYFIKQQNPKEIITYADKRWSDGGLYKKLGFQLTHHTDVNYYYVINGKRVNRYSLRKNILIEKYGCKRDMSEHEFCLKEGWYRIYDCGNTVWKLQTIYR